ncbi:MAG: AarF/ABC1/UbiB kinase family protein [Verrucomicrobiota bacterium]
MNWFQFARLIRAIYGRQKTLPDLEWIQRLGLLAVKLGQVHALRIDFLDREKCLHLAKLYRQNAALAPDDFLKLLAAVAPENFTANFLRIEEKALASASVGQVHRAWLSDGSPVVIKAIKKNVREQFIADVASLRNLFRLATFAYPPLRRVGNPVAILGDIEEYTLSELDLRHEVEGQKILRGLFAVHQKRFDLSSLRFARVHENLGNGNVMVSECVPGKTFDELIAAGELPYAQLIELFRIHGYFMFCIGTFHGDLHPGNVILADGKICLVDTGYIGRVGGKIRRGLFDFFSALSAFDYPRSAAGLNRMSEVELGGAGYAEFEQQFLELYADFTGTTVAQMSLTKKMMQTIKLGVRCGMRFEKGIFAIIRSLMYMDGMVLRCRPDAVLMRDLRPFIAEAEKLV